tara:strand:- start:1855 stop:2127 length:273 start_codon:yes stop_codon:yes gene_type:complete
MTRSVSLREKKEWGANDSAKEVIMVAFRLYGGVAIPLDTICSCVSRMGDDGLITTQMHETHKDFDLPLTKQGQLAHENGQESFVFLVSVH